jgi:hypothetical protein
MYMTPPTIKKVIAQQGHGPVLKALHMSYFDLSRAGYSYKEMKQTLREEFGTEDGIINRELNHIFPV